MLGLFLLLVPALAMPPQERIERQHFKIVILQGVSSKVETLRIAVEDNPQFATKAVEVIFPVILSLADRNNNSKIDTDDLRQIHGEIMDYYNDYVKGTFVDYKMEPDVENFLKIDANGDGEVSLSELQSLVVNQTMTPNWNMAVQFFVQSFDTENSFKGYLSPSEIKAVVDSLAGRFWKLDGRINKTIKHPKEPLPQPGSMTQEKEQEVVVEDDLIDEESAAAYFLRLRRNALETPIDFRKNLRNAWHEMVTKMLDKNNNGYLDEEDAKILWPKVQAYFNQHMMQRQLSAQIVDSFKEWVQSADEDGNGRVDRAELSKLLETEGDAAANTFYGLFVNYLDTNKDGVVSQTEKNAVLPSSMAPLLELRPRSVLESREADAEMKRENEPITDEDALEMQLQEMKLAAKEDASVDGLAQDALDTTMTMEEEAEAANLSEDELEEKLVSVVNEMEMLRMRLANPQNVQAASQIIRDNYEAIVDTIDFDQDGTVTAAEVAQAWRIVKNYMKDQLGREIVDYDTWMQNLTADGQVRMNPELMVKLMTENLQSRMWESMTACLFALAIDSDQDGQLSKAEMAAFEKSDFHRIFELPSMKPEDPSVQP